MGDGREGQAASAAKDDCTVSKAEIKGVQTAGPSLQKVNHPAVNFHAHDSGLCLPLPARQASSCKRQGHCSKTSTVASRPTRNMPTDRFHPEAAAPPRPRSRKPRNGTPPAQARAANSRRPTSTKPTSAWVMGGHEGMGSVRGRRHGVSATPPRRHARGDGSLLSSPEGQP